MSDDVGSENLFRLISNVYMWIAFNFPAKLDIWDTCCSFAILLTISMNAPPFNQAAAATELLTHQNVSKIRFQLSLSKCQKSIMILDVNFWLFNCRDFTVWKFHDFSITQILRQINFGDSWSAKSAILPHLEALNYNFLWIFALFEGWIVPNEQKS